MDSIDGYKIKYAQPAITGVLRSITNLLLSNCMFFMK